MIQNCIPYITGLEEKYLLNALSENSIATGNYISNLESLISDFTNSSYAVALSSGTAALHLSLLAHNISRDDEVIVPAITFAATAFAIKYCEAWPLFMDCDSESGLIDLKYLDEYLANNTYQKDGLTYNKISNRVIKGILPVHLYGHPVDMDKLIDIAKNYNLIIIEDAAEALGSKYKNTILGATYNTSVFSFNGNKIITGGAGGLVITNDLQISKKIRYLANQAKDDGIGFFHQEVGFNYRMPNINAAIVCAQMEHIDYLVECKRNIFNYYETELNGLTNVHMIKEEDWAVSNYWMPVLRVDTNYYKRSINDIVLKLVEDNVHARPVWTPLNTQKAFKDCQKMECENAIKYYQSSMCLPCSCDIREEELEIVCSSLKNILLN